MFSAIIFGLYVLVVVLAVKSVIFVIRYSIAQAQVVKAHKSLMTWSKRHDWALEDGYYVDMTNYEWSVEEVASVYEARKTAFNKAVDSRTLIRF
jgi:hypothetical protein